MLAQALLKLSFILLRTDCSALLVLGTVGDEQLSSHLLILETLQRAPRASQSVSDRLYLYDPSKLF